MKISAFSKTINIPGEYICFNVDVCHVLPHEILRQVGNMAPAHFLPRHSNGIPHYQAYSILLSAPTSTTKRLNPNSELN